MTAPVGRPGREIVVALLTKPYTQVESILTNLGVWEPPENQRDYQPAVRAALARVRERGMLDDLVRALDLAPPADGEHPPHDRETPLAEIYQVRPGRAKRKTSNRNR